MKDIFKVIGCYLWLTILALPLLAGNVLMNPGFELDPIGETNALLGWNA